MDIIQEMRELEREPDTACVALSASGTARTTTSVSTSVIAVNHSQNTNILNSSALTKKESSSSLTSNVSRTYYNTTTSVVTRKRGGLAIAIKRQDSHDPSCNNNNNDSSNTPLSSRQSSYSIPSTPVTPSVPTLRRGLSVRISEASTAICVGNDDNATDSAALKRRPLTCVERFREGILRFFAKIMGSRTPSEADGYDYYDYSELEEFETPARYRPDSLSALSRTTRFTEDEIKRIYRGFKAECPTGVVKEDTFKLIYSQFFPQGANPTLYAHYVFNTLDQDHSGIISFEDFVQGLSILSRGSVEEKLRWTFSLYDINGDGFITREEMTDIVTAIYELMGRLPDECPEEEKIKYKVEHIFQKMDKNRDGVVTLDEFLETCRNDEAISRSMSVFDSAF